MATHVPECYIREREAVLEEERARERDYRDAFMASLAGGCDVPEAAAQADDAAAVLANRRAEGAGS